MRKIFFLAMIIPSLAMASQANNPDDYLNAQEALKNKIVDQILERDGIIKINAELINDTEVVVTEQFKDHNETKIIPVDSSLFRQKLSFKGELVDRVLYYYWKDLNTFHGEKRNLSKATLLIRFLN